MLAVLPWVPERREMATVGAHLAHVAPRHGGAARSTSPPPVRQGPRPIWAWRGNCRQTWAQALEPRVDDEYLWKLGWVFMGGFRLARCASQRVTAHCP
jgi:hypothetical protein